MKAVKALVFGMYCLFRPFWRMFACRYVTKESGAIFSNTPHRASGGLGLPVKFHWNRPCRFASNSGRIQLGSNIHL